MAHPLVLQLTEEIKQLAPLSTTASDAEALTPLADPLPSRATSKSDGNTEEPIGKGVNTGASEQSDEAEDDDVTGLNLIGRQAKVNHPQYCKRKQISESGVVSGVTIYKGNLCLALRLEGGEVREFDAERVVFHSDDND